MLTKELLRYKIERGTVKAYWLRETPAVVRAIQAVLQAHQQHLRATRQELDEELQRVAAAERSSVMVRGLAKIIGDQCQFDDPEACAEQRWPILAASAQRLQAGADEDPLAHRQSVSAELALPEDADIAESLYADLPHLACLREVPSWSVTHVIQAYNTGLAQGLLLRCQAVDIELPASDVAMQRRVLVAIRFHRLLAEVLEHGDAGLRLRVAGPGSVIDQGRRYGLQLAQLLPALADCPRWSATATLPDGRQTANLELGHELELRSRAHAQSWIPPELQQVSERLRKREPDWQVSEQATLLPTASGELIVPDLEIRQPGGHPVFIEFFHRWHQAAFERRLQHLEQQPGVPLGIGVDRALAKRKAVQPLLESAVFHQRGFLFSGYPSVTALRGCVHQISQQ